MADYPPYPDWYTNAKNRKGKPKQTWRCSTEGCTKMTRPGIGPRFDGENWVFECQKCRAIRKKTKFEFRCAVDSGDAKPKCYHEGWYLGYNPNRLALCPFCPTHHQVLQCTWCVDEQGHDNCGWGGMDYTYDG